MEQPNRSEQLLERRVPVPPRQEVFDRFRMLYAPMAIVSVVLLFVPLTTRGLSMWEALSVKGASIFHPLQLALIVLLVAASFRARSVALPVAIAACAAGWVLMVILGVTTSRSSVGLSVGGLAGLTLMVGTGALAVAHAVLERRRAETVRG